MNQTIDDHRLMPAQNPAQNPSTPLELGTTGPHRGEEVNQMATTKRTRRSSARAWDELSEVDRAVLLEAVRQRREAAEHRRSVLAGLNSSRHLR